MLRIPRLSAIRPSRLPVVIGLSALVVAGCGGTTKTVTVREPTPASASSAASLEQQFGALGVVLLSVSMLLEDALIALAGILLAATGIALELAPGGAALHGISPVL